MTERTTGTLPRRPARYQLDSAVGGQTAAERAAKGKAARAEVPRTSHAVFDPPAPTGPIRSPSWPSRRRRGCRNWCRSGGAG